MITLNENQIKVLVRAINIIARRKKTFSIGRSGLITGMSAINVAINTISRDDDDLSNYECNHVIQSIAKPWAILFFAGNSSNVDGIEDQLADFIEHNTQPGIS